MNKNRHPQPSNTWLFACLNPIRKQPHERKWWQSSNLLEILVRKGEGVVWDLGVNQTWAPASLNHHGTQVPTTWAVAGAGESGWKGAHQGAHLPLENAKQCSLLPFGQPHCPWLLWAPGHPGKTSSPYWRPSHQWHWVSFKISHQNLCPFQPESSTDLLKQANVLLAKAVLLQQTGFVWQLLFA